MTISQRLELIRLLAAGEEILPEWAHILFPTLERENELIYYGKGLEKANCWQFKKCGREPGGSKIKDLGICPAATDKRLDDIHGGLHAGRACWVIAGTFCGGKIQGTFAQKFSSCRECDFYQIVFEEETHNFFPAHKLIARLKGPCPADKRMETGPL